MNNDNDLSRYALAILIVLLFALAMVRSDPALRTLPPATPIVINDDHSINVCVGYCPNQR